MTIASEITRINNNIANAYTACNDKGATMPVTQNSANLATCIDSIQTGGTSSKYGATIDSLLGDVDSNGVLQFPTAQTDLVFTGVEDVVDYALYCKFYRNTGVSSVSFPDLTNLSGDYSLSLSFNNSTGITSVDLSNLATVSGQYALNAAFRNCSALINLDLSGLTTVSGQNAFYYAFDFCGFSTLDLSSLTTIGSASYGMEYAFSNTEYLTSVDLSNLATISSNTGLGYAFDFYTAFGRGAQNLLTTISFTALSDIAASGVLQYCFRARNGLQTVSFPALTSTSFGSYTNQFNNMLSGVTGCTVHFPSNLQSVIGSWSSVTAGFGGTNTTVLFDLRATT